MDVTGTTGTAWRDGEIVGEFELKGGRSTGARGREVEHVEIRFPDFVASEVAAALAAIRQRKRLSRPLLVDLEFDRGGRQDGCEIAGFWGGAIGEQWFGIHLDLDALDASASA